MSQNQSEKIQYNKKNVSVKKAAHIEQRQGKSYGGFCKKDVKIYAQKTRDELNIAQNATILGF